MNARMNKVPHYLNFLPSPLAFPIMSPGQSDLHDQSSHLHKPTEPPLISIELKIGTLNIYDRQVALQVIRGHGSRLK